MRLRLASRKSDLARWQSVQVARALEALPEKPHSEFIFKASMGDQNLDAPLAQLGSKGVFTEDFYADLVHGQCDLVVHSWKDLPVEERADTRIAMTLPRADARDVLLIPETVWAHVENSGNLSILTSSPRRAYNLAQFLPTLLPGAPTVTFANVRGNVPTRLRKMHELGAALVLAKAGVDRLLQAEDAGFLEAGLSLRELIGNCRFMVLPLSLNPGAPAQGALAVEILRANETLHTLCAALNDQKTYACVNLEREILKHYGGGCHQKIGVTLLTRAYGQVTSLRGLTDQGEVLERWTIENSTPWSKAATRAQIFPLGPEANAWFDRETIPTTVDLATKPALQIARAEALPEGFRPSPGQWVWTAGVQTWQRLAKLGVWVHGSFDGLGESEPTEIEGLVGHQIEWTKLSHTQGTGQVSTYRLRPKPQSPDLTGKTHLFWMSSSAFARAREIFPEVINNGFNASGPGSTFEHIRCQSGLRHPVKVFAGLKQFLAETAPYGD